MINEKEIMPFNFFKYGGIYTGGHNGMRYKIERTGEKPDYVLNVLIWQGPYASTAMKEEDITAKEFEYSEEGRSSAIQWIQGLVLASSFASIIAFCCIFLLIIICL